MTSRAAKTILDLCAQELSYAEIARDTGANAAKIQAMLRVACEELDKVVGNKLGKCTGVDDFWIGRRPTFTIADTGPGGVLNAILENRETETLRAALARFPNGHEVEDLTLDCCDEILAAAKEGDKEHAAPLPNASPAINHFHYGKYVIRCFNQARLEVFKKIKKDLLRDDPVKRQQFLFRIKTKKQLAEEAKKRVKNRAESTRKTFLRLDFLLKKRPENLKVDGPRIVNFVLGKYPLLAEAYELKNFALNIRAAGKTTAQSLAEVELFKMQLGKLPKNPSGKAIVKCFEPLLNLLKKWGAAAFPTCKGNNNNLEEIHRGLRVFIRLGRGYSIPGLLRRARWRAFHKTKSRWPKEFAGQPKVTLRRISDQMRNRKAR
jgi:hypothetical protein